MTINYTGVTLRHNKRIILSDVNFLAQPGEMIYLTGLVGSGKSTLLSSIYGNTIIHSGKAKVLNYDMSHIGNSKLQHLRRKIGIVHQDLRLLSDRTVQENLDFVLRATEWNSKDIRQERIEEVLSWVQLTDKLHCYPYELSGGQKQCICIARSILNHPELILADEPTGQLDSENGELVMALLYEVRRQTGCTVVVSTHNPQWPEIFPGTTYVCQDGKLIKRHSAPQNSTTIESIERYEIDNEGADTQEN